MSFLLGLVANEADMRSTASSYSSSGRTSWFSGSVAFDSEVMEGRIASRSDQRRFQSSSAIQSVGGGAGTGVAKGPC